MAATVTKDFMLKVMRERKLPYFQVTDGRDVIFEQQDEMSQSKAEEMLCEVLDNVQDNFVYVRIHAKAKKELGKGGNTKGDYFEYKIQLRAPGRAGINGTEQSDTTRELMQKIETLQTELHKKEIEVLRDEMNRKIDELSKADKSSPMQDMALQVLSGFLTNSKAPFKTPVGVAGVEDGPVNEANAKRQEKVRAALARLFKIDSHFDDTLCSLADFAESKPEQFKSFIPIVKSMI